MHEVIWLVNSGAHIPVQVALPNQYVMELCI